MDNPYPYPSPPPDGYQNHPSPPPAIPDPHHSPYQAPPPRYLYHSHSFTSYQSPPSHPQNHFNHSGSLHYPPQASYPPSPPPPHLGPSASPLNYSYDPYYYAHPSPHPYVYPDSVPYDGLSASHPHHQPSDHALLSAHSPSSSSIYPIDNPLSNVRLSDEPPSPGSLHHRPGIYHYHHQSFSGSFSSDESRHGAIVPFAGSPSSHHQPGGYDYQHQFFSGSFSSGTPPSAPPETPSSESQHGAIVPFAGSLSSIGGASLKVLLLHGSLDIWVYEAKELPNMDLFHKTLGDMLGSRITSCIRGKVESMASITSDPYVTVNVCDATIARTYVVNNSENPVWMQHFNVPVAHHTAEVEFLVKDSDIVGAQIIGTVSIPTVHIYSGEKVEGTYPILGPNGKQCKPGAVLKLSIQYVPVERLSIYHHGIGANPDYCGVPDTYFPLRKGGKVTLYQDAHVPDGCLPDLGLGNGMYYEHAKCWHDIFDAISNSRRLIYIIGWSVFHTIHLVRDAGNSSSPILGDLLKSKSQEGVRVLLLIWDDPTSRNILGYRTVKTHTIFLSFLACGLYTSFSCH